MALDKAGLIADIKSILNNTKTKEVNQQTTINDYATQLAEAIDKYVKTGTVNTAGSASAQVGTIS